jgi:hypothetical protein
MPSVVDELCLVDDIVNPIDVFELVPGGHNAAHSGFPQVLWWNSAYWISKFAAMTRDETVRTVEPGSRQPSNAL